MRSHNRSLWLSAWLVVGLSLATALAAPPADAEVQTKVVRFAGLEEAVRQHKGKVVVVDFWADFCVPCKKAFPSLVALHNKHVKEGLAVISVNLDDPADEKVRERAIQFLKDKKATFTNLFIDPQEKPEDWFTKLRIDSIPSMFVF